MDALSANPAWWWLSLAIALLIIEMLSGTLVFLFISAGAFLVALTTWLLGPGVVLQGLMFAFTTVVALLAWRRFRPNPGDKLEQLAGASGLNNRMASFIGREAVLEEAMVNGQGRIRMDDSFWNVTGEPLPAGARVRIVAVEGMVLRVQSL